MRHMVSLSEFRSARTHTFHHGCNIPIRMAGNQASMIDLHDRLAPPDQKTLEQGLRRGLLRYRDEDGVIRVPGLAWVVCGKK